MNFKKDLNSLANDIFSKDYVLPVKKVDQKIKSFDLQESKKIENIFDLDLDEDFDLDIEQETEPEEKVEQLFDGYLGEKNFAPNPLEYGPNAMYRQNGTVYKKSVDNLWEAYLKDGSPGPRGSAGGSGTGVQEVQKIAGDVASTALGNYNLQYDFPKTSNVSWNSYDLFYRHFDIYNNVWGTVPNDITISAIEYVKECKGDVIRIVYPVYTSAQIRDYVFTGSVPNRDFVDSDFNQDFLRNSDLWFEYCETNDIKQHITLFWDKDYIASLNGDIVTSAFRNLNTATVKYMERFTRWFVTRYKKNRTISMISFGNEWTPFELASTEPWTIAELKAIIDDLSSVVKSVNVNMKVTADLLFPMSNITKTRKTIEWFTEFYTNIFENCDAWTLHAYSNFNYVGLHTAYSSVFAPTSANNFGFDSLENVLSVFRTVAKANGKYLIMGEIGVSRTMETDSATLKKNRVVEACKKYCDYSMLWNLQSYTNASAQSNQDVWWTFPGDTRADTYKTILQNYNSLEYVQTDLVSIGTSSLVNVKSPSNCFTANRSATGRIQFQSTSAMAISGDYCVMFWVRQNESFNAFERLFDLRNALGTAGTVMLASTSGASTWYIAAKTPTSAEIGSLNAYVNPLVLNEWNHITYYVRKSNATTSATIYSYLNGNFWYAIAANANMGFVPFNTTLYVGGQATTGAPVSFQDFTVLNSFNPKDIMKHIKGEVLPQSLIHIRAFESGDISDMSRYNIPLTLGTVVTEQLK